VAICGHTSNNLDLHHRESVHRVWSLHREKAMRVEGSHLGFSGGERWGGDEVTTHKLPITATRPTRQQRSPPRLWSQTTPPTGSSPHPPQQTKAHPHTRIPRKAQQPHPQRSDALDHTLPSPTTPGPREQANDTTWADQGETARERTGATAVPETMNRSG
ncbi:MAG: hypothetical protein GY832_00850, partial [Chloroflexi bacterium]|nr:hypothetical protein [Chloroflexota bacterium]